VKGTDKSNVIAQAMVFSVPIVMTMGFFLVSLDEDAADLGSRKLRPRREDRCSMASNERSGSGHAASAGNVRFRMGSKAPASVALGPESNLSPQRRWRSRIQIDNEMFLDRKIHDTQAG